MDEAQLQAATEAIYEDEQLRSNLTDDEANALLGWGERQLGGGSQSKDIDAPADPLAAVKDKLAAVNELVGERASLTPDELRGRVGLLLGSKAAALPAAAAKLAAQPEVSNLDFINRLLPLLAEQPAAGGALAAAVGSIADGVQAVQQATSQAAATPPKPQAGKSRKLCARRANGCKVKRGRQG